MPKVTFTKENLLERKPLTAKWRKLKVKSVTEKAGVSDPDSITYPTVFIVEEGDDAGVPINHWFTEKQMGRLSEYLACFIPSGVAESKEYELNDTVGRSVLGYCEYDSKTGFNVVKDFKPVGK